MNMKDRTLEVFFALVRAGLWAKANLNDNLDLSFEGVDWGKVYRLAEEQSVIGLASAGLDRFKVQFPGFKIPQDWALQFIGATLQIEQQNTAMNSFIADLIERMRKTGIYTLLVKGQGVAQCYEKPLWRASGDVDLFLSEENYNKAKNFLQPLATGVEIEGKHSKHLGMTIEGWTVELHGTLRCGLSSRVDRVMDNVKEDVFYGGNVRSWQNGKTQVFLLSVENDILFVFTHFLKHFYKEGLGLRQICDWCRLLCFYRSSLKNRILEQRVREMGLMSEWKAFGAYAVEYLGMPVEAMPMYSDAKKWKRKARRINDFILRVGNMGHNRDTSYFATKPYFVRKVLSFNRRMGDLMNHARIFPLDSFRFSPRIMFNGLRSAVRGE